MIKGTMMDEQELIACWLLENEWQPAETRLREFGTEIWALVSHLPAVNGSVSDLAFDYEIPEEAAQAAIAYYHRHRAAIDGYVTAKTNPYIPAA